MVQRRNGAAASEPIQPPVVGPKRARPADGPWTACRVGGLIDFRLPAGVTVAYAGR